MRMRKFAQLCVYSLGEAKTSAEKRLENLVFGTMLIGRGRDCSSKALEGARRGGRGSKDLSADGQLDEQGGRRGGPTVYLPFQGEG